jgi:glyoxylase-like metal-dependent hydrolase (beta-lactamase superfamily II)
VFEVYHTPGHTKGQSAVYVPQEKIVIVGDTIFSGCQIWLNQANPDCWLQSLEFLRTLDVDYIIPGHGPVITKEYIPKQAAFIREWVTAVAAGIAKGWGKEVCIERISFLDRLPMDIGQESVGPMVQEMNVANLYDFLTHKGRWTATGI